MLDYLIKDAKIVDGTGSKAFSGDIAIKDGKIIDIGLISQQAKEIIKANGAYATPGWVDIHTHLDGQVSWDSKLDPSFSHGVTSVIMGNCGVGFAPVPKGGEKRLIELMEGVEDIPGTALYEGIEWGSWETFPEYMDYLATKEYTMDIGTQIPHSALRYYVMGDRAINHEDATDQELKAMCEIVSSAINAGALGFSTSRVAAHRSMTGEPIPGTFAAKEELFAIAEALDKTNKGVFQVVPSGSIGNGAGIEKYTIEQELELMGEIARICKRNLTFSLFQPRDQPNQWRYVLDRVAELNTDGAQLRPQVSSRPIGFVTGLQVYHMFQRREAYLKIAHLPLAERVAEMQKAEVKKAILASKDIPTGKKDPASLIHMTLRKGAAITYPLSYPINYEPEASQSFAALAAADEKSEEEYIYDYLVANNGENFAIWMATNYVEGNLNVIHDMLLDPNSVIGLTDAGAHVNMIFDAVSPTYQLTHWVRDRTRGEKLPLEFLVAKQTLANAELYGLTDRGSIKVGKRADINLFDLDKLQLGKLEVPNDLPAGGHRILQSAQGYLNTFVNGVKTRENDEDTGARPGRLVRSI